MTRVPVNLNLALEEEGNSSKSGSVLSIVKDVDSVSPEGTNSFLEKLSAVPCIGILLALLSGIFFATASFIIKLLPDVHPIQIVVCRSLIQMVVYTTTIVAAKLPICGAPGDRKYLLMRGVFGFIALALAYTSFRLIPLADASAIIFSAPVYVSIFACVLLKEPCGVFQIGVISLTIAGVFLISKPTFIFGESLSSSEPSLWRLEGTMTSFASSLSAAFTFVMIRKLKNTPSAVVIFYFSLYSVAFGTLVLLVLYFFFDQDTFRVPSRLDEYLLLLGNGLCGVFGQLFLTLALKYEEAGLVSLARTIDIVMAFIYQVAFLDELIAWTSILGAIIVCLGVIISALRKWYKGRPALFSRFMPKTKKKRKGRISESEAQVNVASNNKKDNLQGVSTISYNGIKDTS